MARRPLLNEASEHGYWRYQLTNARWSGMDIEPRGFGPQFFRNRSDHTRFDFALLLLFCATREGRWGISPAALNKYGQRN
jgi:hypothetical protein